MQITNQDRLFSTIALMMYNLLTNIQNLLSGIVLSLLRSFVFNVHHIPAGRKIINTKCVMITCKTICRSYQNITKTGKKQEGKKDTHSMRGKNLEILQPKYD